MHINVMVYQLIIIIIIINHNSKNYLASFWLAPSAPESVEIMSSKFNLLPFGEKEIKECAKRKYDDVKDIK